MDDLRYANYGEKHDDPSNTHKFWLIFVRDSTVSVIYGRAINGARSTHGMERRAEEIWRTRSRRRTQEIAYDKRLGPVPAATAKAEEKRDSGYTMLANWHASWEPPNETRRGWTRRQPPVEPIPEPMPDAPSAEVPLPEGFYPGF